MDFSRCDHCCDVMGGIDDGEVFECDYEVQDKYIIEHLCKDCIDSDDELYLYFDGVINLVKIKKENKDV